MKKQDLKQELDTKRKVIRKLWKDMEKKLKKEKQRQIKESGLGIKLIRAKNRKKTGIGYVKTGKKML